MSMDAAVSRMPECPGCGKRVDENAPELPYYVIDGVHYHAKCYEGPEPEGKRTDSRES